MTFCPVDIWTFDLDAPRSIVLQPDEQARADRFRFGHDRRHWAHARSALRVTLAQYVVRAPEELRFEYGPNGKPALLTGNGLEFNISHSRRWAMLAVTHGIPVGIDIEEIREKVNIADLLRRLGETKLTGTCEELFHVWTRREARTKALGAQLMQTPEADLRVADLPAPAGFAATVALLGIDPRPLYRTEPPDVSGGTLG